MSVQELSETNRFNERENYHALLLASIRAYRGLALALRQIVLKGPNLTETKQQVEQYCEKLAELRKPYGDTLHKIEAHIHEAEGRAPGYFYGSDPTEILDCPGLIESDEESPVRF
jgi:hypothetical protein